jgi:hypothetical protein
MTFKVKRGPLLSAHFGFQEAEVYEVPALPLRFSNRTARWWGNCGVTCQLLSLQRGTDGLSNDDLKLPVFIFAF